MRIAGIVVFAMLFTLNCSGKDRQQAIDATGYDLSAPSKTWKLPGSLKEISGIVFIDSVRLACVQDEKGIIYIFNILSGQVEKRLDVLPDGDYEGIAYDGTSYYILRSDGIVFRISDSVEVMDGNAVADNIEGLCYDKTNLRLLIAAKSQDSKETKHLRFVWTMRTQSYMWPNALPALIIDFKELADFRKNQDGYHKKYLEFNPSDIAIHSKTSDIYLISAQDQKMIVYRDYKTIIYIGSLDPAILPQPEGIAFDTEGNMYIASEGVDGKASINMYKYSGKDL